MWYKGLTGVKGVKEWSPGMGTDAGGWSLHYDPKKVKEEIEAYLKAKDLAFDSHVYLREEWRERDEKYGNDAVITITTEGPLGRLLNYGDWSGAEEELEDWNRFLEERGLWWELGYAWSVHLYPTDRPPTPSGVKEWRPAIGLMVPAHLFRLQGRLA